MPKPFTRRTTCALRWQRHSSLLLYGAFKHYPIRHTMYFCCCLKQRVHTQILYSRLHDNTIDNARCITAFPVDALLHRAVQPGDAALQTSPQKDNPGTTNSFHRSRFLSGAPPPPPRAGQGIKRTKNILKAPEHAQGPFMMYNKRNHHSTTISYPHPLHDVRDAAAGSFQHDGRLWHQAQVHVSGRHGSFCVEVIGTNTQTQQAPHCQNRRSALRQLKKKNKNKKTRAIEDAAAAKHAQKPPTAAKVRTHHYPPFYYFSGNRRLRLKKNTQKSDTRVA